MAQGRGGVGLETRIALAVCVVLGSTLCGRAAADALRRRCRVLISLVAEIRALRGHMTGMLLPVRGALEKTGGELLGRVAAAMGDGRGADEAWRSVRGGAARRGGPADALTQADLAVLDALFSQLGQSGREAQEALLAEALRSLEALRDEALGRAREAERLYVSLGLLIGLMLALIVI